MRGVLSVEANIDSNDKNLIAGEWTKIDSDNEVTEITFLTTEEFIAKITFDFKEDKVLVEGDLSKITDSEENDEFIQTYKDSSKEILKIF